MPSAAHSTALVSLTGEVELTCEVYRSSDGAIAIEIETGGLHLDCDEQALHRLFACASDALGRIQALTPHPAA